MSHAPAAVTASAAPSQRTVVMVIWTYASYARVDGWAWIPAPYQVRAGSSREWRTADGCEELTSAMPNQRPLRKPLNNAPRVDNHLGLACADGTSRDHS